MTARTECKEFGANLLGSEARKAPFEVPKLDPGHKGQPATKPGPVFQMSLRSQELDDPLLLTLWPSLGRVDVRLGRPYWALQGDNLSGTLPWSRGALPSRRPVGVPVRLSQGTCRPSRIARLGPTNFGCRQPMTYVVCEH